MVVVIIKQIGLLTQWLRRSEITPNFIQDHFRTQKSWMDGDGPIIHMVHPVLSPCHENIITTIIIVSVLQKGTWGSTP